MINLRQLVAAIDAHAFPVEWPGNLIAGTWTPPPKSKLTKVSMNPNRAQKLMEVTIDKQPILKAIAAAEKIKTELVALSIKERVEIMQRFRQRLADYEKYVCRLLQLEIGKPAWEAAADISAALKYLDDIIARADDLYAAVLAPARAASKGGSFALLPVGTALAYLPFSTPITSFVFNVSAALLAGCPLIIMPSSHCILSSVLYGYLCEDIDAPPGAINLVFGNFELFRQALTDRSIEAVIFTGSREHCEFIRRESHAIPERQLILQSGGKNSVIIHSSADLNLAVKCVTFGAIKSAGQLCTSTSRVFVYQSLKDEFTERLVSTLGKLTIGPTDIFTSTATTGPMMGPLYSKKAVEKFLRFQTMAGRESSETLIWGKAIDLGNDGHFVSPGLHVMGKLDPASAYQSNVLFSPDIALYTYDVLDNVVEQVNRTDAAFAVSFIGEKATLESRRLAFDAPNLLLNQPTVEIDATLPLAGRQHSGHHRYNGPSIALCLTYPQVISAIPSNQTILNTWPWPKD